MRVMNALAARAGADGALMSDAPPRASVPLRVPSCGPWRSLRGPSAPGHRACRAACVPCACGAPEVATCRPGRATARCGCSRLRLLRPLDRERPDDPLPRLADDVVQQPVRG